ncbi:MAG: hypothetical protein B7Y25_07205 [Alphaproteobacteria bacterium 16-39-46]|nr:MAG: hypothetical protein B7Y25_07205 [Alphaproteobacteria bacterium 16-39-46]OZA41795.1 MAG: hypothetical protein B7X84_07360 [Alphaproteobacteria bacterium 17-39-52]HQS84696.1 GNAT family N-acetyltransferase [Alphaproteobacteria bacterium]HQS94517.1 GNAT family N-acetyltransferase [Alphaproteobacteria bacterium]
MNITFERLQESHFPLLLNWLDAPHVKTWWDSDIQWTPELVLEKYGGYVLGIKREEGILKKIQAFVISGNHQPIGYIQLYNAYDFQRGSSLEGFPDALAAVDFFIGEKDFLGRGLGSDVLKKFLETFCKNDYSTIFVDPDHRNVAALRTYEKAGFKKVEENLESGKILMVKYVG